MLNRELEQLLNNAFVNARHLRYQYLTEENLLLCLLDNALVNEALVSCGADVDAMKEELKIILQKSPTIASDNDDQETQPTLGFQRVLQRAVFHVQSSGQKQVRAINVLISLFSESESEACDILKRQGVSRLDMVNHASCHVSNETEGASQDLNEHTPPPLGKSTVYATSALVDNEALLREFKELKTSNVQLTERVELAEQQIKALKQQLNELRPPKDPP